MRYTADDYSAAMNALTGNSRTVAHLSPQERRILAQLRTAYVMHADVARDECELARRVLAAARANARTTDIKEP